MTLKPYNKLRKLLKFLLILQLQNLENELQRKNKAIELAQEDINTANGQIEHLATEINDLLASRNVDLVCN